MSPLLPLHGHATLRERLGAQVRAGTLPASILLHGPSGVGKQRLALWLAQAIVCGKPDAPCGTCQACQYAVNGTHPDLHWFFPIPNPKIGSDPAVEEAKEVCEGVVADRLQLHGLYARPSGSEAIYLFVVRLLVQQAALSPAMASRKVFVIGDAERMVPQASNQEAANALLKLLEEPPPATTLILTSSEPSSLLPTIRSRVVAFRVPRLGDDDVRRFLAQDAVRAALGPGGNDDERVRLADGAPGRLLGHAEQAAAFARARAMIDAARHGRAQWIRTAFGAGGKGARGAFSDVLDAVSVLLHEQSRDAAMHGNERAAVAAARAMRSVEEAKLAAQSNVSPQLLSARLLRDLSELGA